MGAKPTAEQLAVSGQRGPLRDLANAYQTGIATLAGGTIVVSAELTANSRITVTRNTPGGTLGNLSAPAASRNVGASTFVINSDDAGETSTVDWKVEG